MRIRCLPSALDGSPEHQFATSYLINESVAIDAGPLGFADLADQAKVRHVFLSHAHADHVGTLPIFVENVYEPNAACVKVWGSEHVLESLQSDVFNGRVFPDFLGRAPADAPFLEVEKLETEVAVSVEQLEIVPVPMDHTVPTFGFVVQAADATVLIASDTAPTTRVWEIANQLPTLSAVFLEASFPDRMVAVAEASKHLTPEMFGRETAKLERDVTIIAVHLKARFHEETAAELTALGITELQIGVAGKEYRFSE